MRLNFKKITAIATSALMIGMSAGIAAAASYPEPFVSSGTANVALVYGTGDGVSALDAVQAGNIQKNLQTSETVIGSASTTTGGDSVKLEKSSTKFRLGQGRDSVITTSITDDSPGDGLPILLADGKYTDDDNDEFDYTQKIDLSNFTLTMWEDNDYKADEPTVGIRIASGAHVMNYTLDFTDEPLWADLDSTNIEIMGKTYFILSHTANTTLNLLDSGNTASVAEGETITVEAGGNSYEISIQYISATECKLNVNGELTNSLQETHTQKLKDGAYVGIKDIMHDSKTGSISSVEFSVGTGKLVLTHGSDIQINDETISDMKTYITTDSQYGKVQKIVLEWKAEDDLFATPNDAEMIMPGFEAVKLTFAGMYYPKEETIIVKHGGDSYIELQDFPFKDSTETVAILFGNNTHWKGIGKDNTHQLVTNNDTSPFIIFDGDIDSYFIASYNDGSNAESYLMRATNFKEDTSAAINKTTIQYKKDGVWTDVKKDASITSSTNDTASIGNVELTIDTIDKNLKTVKIFYGTNVKFNMLYSNQGLQVYLPWNISDTSTQGGQAGAICTNASGALTTYHLDFVEEDKNGNIGAGGTNITATLGWNSATTKQAYVSDVANESVTFDEILSTDIYRSFTYTALASELLWNKGGDQYYLTIKYHGDESYGEIYLTAPGTTISSANSGVVVVKDSEVSSVSSKNLIIVGGTCINSAAAKVLGGSYCGASFTQATGVGSGEFLIQSVGDAYTTGKIALVVAGYNVEDTANAATYVTTQTVDTTAGKKYKGTSATAATLVTSE